MPRRPWDLVERLLKPSVQGGPGGSGKMRVTARDVVVEKIVGDVIAAPKMAAAPPEHGGIRKHWLDRDDRQQRRIAHSTRCASHTPAAPRNRPSGRRDIETDEDRDYRDL
jgi:hypothetical protein